MGLDQGKQGPREYPGAAAELESKEVTVSQSASGRGCLLLLPRGQNQGGGAAGRPQAPDRGQGSRLQDRGPVSGVFVLLHETFLKPPLPRL